MKCDISIDLDFIFCIVFFELVTTWWEPMEVFSQLKFVFFPDGWECLCPLLHLRVLLMKQFLKPKSRRNYLLSIFQVNASFIWFLIFWFHGCNTIFIGVSCSGDTLNGLHCESFLLCVQKNGEDSIEFNLIIIIIILSKQTMLKSFLCLFI